MRTTDLQREMNRQLEEKNLFEQAKTLAFDYFDHVEEMDAVPSSERVRALVQVGEAVPDASGLFETVTFRSTATLATKPRQFLRVRVTEP